MAFHIACPFTCRKICFCILGTPAVLQSLEAKQSLLQNAKALENLLTNPRVYGGETTVDVLVPRLSKESKKRKQKTVGPQVEAESGEDAFLGSSKKGVIRKKVTVSSVLQDASAKAELVAAGQLAEAEAVLKSRTKNGKGGAEGIGGLLGSVTHVANDVSSRDDYLHTLLPQVVCGLCTSVETVDTEREKRMLHCRSCSKRYHRKCLKLWAEHRDLFNWANWECGSCRSCVVCKRTGEPNKLMFCKRCDDALHIYCQQPPLKHVPKGPYLCPRHTHCHSCGSNVPGSGVSSRWFMSFTTCDACGRLFMKDKYCPVCLKVYRDSEATPMVCCDSCEHWVHCQCDGISDEKFNQFQTDDNLRYKCAACRGDCHKVRNVDDAVSVLWTRRDEADAQQRAELRAAAGLPSKEEMLTLCPSSDDEKKPHTVDQVPVGLKRSGKLKKKVKKKDVKQSIAEIDSREGVRKPTLKIVPPNPDTAGEMYKMPRIIIKASRSGRTKTARELVEDGFEPAEDTEGSNLNEILKGPADVLARDQTAKKVKEINHHSDREARNDKRLGSGMVVDVQPVTSEIDTRTPKTKKLKVVDNGASEAAVAHTWIRGLVRSKNRKAGIRGGVKHPGVILDNNAAASADSAEVSTSSADVDQLQDGTIPDILYAKNPRNDGNSFVDNTPKDMFPLQSWGGHGTSDNARRRRMPSSKFRDMEVSTWLPSKGIPGSVKGDGDVLSEAVPMEILHQKDNGGGSRQGVSDFRTEGKVKFSVTQQRGNASNFMAAADDSSGAPKKKMKVVEIGDRGGHDDDAEGSRPKVALRLKIRNKQGGKTVTDGAVRGHINDEEETSTVKGHRSKRKRPGATESGGKEDVGLSTDIRILQRLGADAVSKRVEVFWPMDNQWYKGTVIRVFPQQAQFSLRYDDGEEETLDFGKERVRLLSSRE
ncbi:hypothetical protein R1flu_018095 [Riccia fluitans]|uniref:PHD-type domain-containing protein n=1 Tax=Riccia fluitans TaxID=41844 RepID=A0ABD1ZEU5_9MARC